MILFGRILIVTIFTFVLFCFNGIVYADVRFNEINWKGVTGNQYAEWIELYNDSSDPVDLSGYVIYKDDGGVLFTLTKTISGNGYLLIERTTGSSPDPVSGINDESGSFGGGGLSNSGESLVLNNSSGSEVDSVSFYPGGAGDSYTETMQWDGSSWINGSPTPKNQNVQNNSSEEENNSNNSESTGNNENSTSSANTKKLIPQVVTKSLKIKKEGGLFIDSPISFSADLILSDGKTYKSGFVTWSMGDGSSFIYKISDSFNYSYKYEGEYLVMAEYRKSTSFENDVDASARMVVKISANLISITPVSDGAIEVKNSATTEIDLSGWKVSANNKIFVFPKNTIILAGKKITISKNQTGFLPEDTYLPVLIYPDGVIAYSFYKKEYAKKSSTMSVSLDKNNSSQNTNTLNIKEESDDTEMFENSSLSANVVLADNQGIKSVYFLFGTIALVFTGIASVFIFRNERKMLEGDAYDFEINEKKDD